MSSPQVFHGSCHCGDIQYELRLTLPPARSMDKAADAVRIYKCNCTLCHKANMFHCRPISNKEDFIMTSPSDPEHLGLYTAVSHKIRWYFCKKCGVRTFSVGGLWEQLDMDVDKWAGKEGHAQPQKVWRTKADEDNTAFNGQPLHYVSVNAVTLDGVDLVEWHDKKWIFYVENRERKGDDMPGMRFLEPWAGGCY